MTAQPEAQASLPREQATPSPSAMEGWQQHWPAICEAAFERAKLSDAKAATALRPAFRAIITAALAAAPPPPGEGAQELCVRLLIIHDKLRSGMFGQREVWERWLKDAVAALQALAPPPPGEGDGDADDASFVADLKRLYSLGHERGDAGGSARDDFWDTLDLEVGRLLDIAERAAAPPAVRMPGRRGANYNDDADYLASMIAERQASNIMDSVRDFDGIVAALGIEDRPEVDVVAAVKELIEKAASPQGDGWRGDGVYVASRASLPERSAMWRRFRDQGVKITSSWIDEAGEGETESFAELWARIIGEIAASERVVLYAEPDDFPLKGALVEAGIALGMGKPVTVCLPSVAVSGRTHRPIGSWIECRLVRRSDNIAAALAGLPSPPHAEEKG